MAQVARDLGVADHLLYCWWVEQQQTETQACWDYRLQQEFITPSTPEQNGIIDRFFRSLKKRACLATHVPDGLGAARHTSADALVQPGTSISGAGVSKPNPISRPTSSSGGLISGEPYRGGLTLRTESYWIQNRKGFTAWSHKFNRNWN